MQGHSKNMKMMNHFHQACKWFESEGTYSLPEFYKKLIEIKETEDVYVKKIVERSL